MIRRFTPLLLLVLAVFPLAYSLAYASPGGPQGYVNDFARLLSESEKQEIETVLRSFGESSGVEFAVAIVPSLGGETLESYANRLFREWGIGSEETDKGILFLIAPREKKLRLEVGYGLEGDIPDLRASRLIEEYAIPRFREEKYREGIEDTVHAVALLLQGSELPSTIENASVLPSSDVWMGILFFGYVIISWLLSVMSRTKEWWLGGILGFLVSGVLWFFFGQLVALGSVVPLVLLGLVIDYTVSKGYRDAKDAGFTPPWWTGGTWGSGGGSFGGGSGGFGGFGGGSSGGGGASGRW